MPRLINPFTGKPVDAPDALVGRLRGAGFTEEQKPKRSKKDKEE